MNEQYYTFPSKELMEEILAEQGSHARNHNLFSTDHPDVDTGDSRADKDFVVWDLSLGKYLHDKPLGTATRAGLFMLGSQAQAEAGATGNYAVTTSVFKAALDSVLAARFYPRNVSILAPSGAVTWASMPLAITEFLGLTMHRFSLDATGASQIRLYANVVAAGSTGASLRLQFSQDGGTTWNNAGLLSADAITIDATSLRGGAWTDLSAAAKGDRIWRLIGFSGNGTASPQFGAVGVAFK